VNKSLASQTRPGIHLPKRKPAPTNPPPATSRRGAQSDNTNATRHGVYSRHFTDDELNRIIAPLLTGQPSLTPEIEATRVLFDRSLARLNAAGLETADFIALSQLNLQTSGRIAMLLRNHTVITGEAHDNLAGHVADALTELSAILNTEL